jgi:2'-5' RNA ligase
MAAPVGSDLYFLAIMADEPAKSEILRFKNEILDQFGCKAALNSDAHITIIPPFWWSKIFRPVLLQTVQQITLNINSFNIHLNGFGNFYPRVLFAKPEPNDSIIHLKNSLIAQLKPLLDDKIKDAFPFHPHVTIANRDLLATDFQAAWALFENRKYQSSWNCKNVTLLRHDGKRWNEEMQIPLSY